MNGDALMTRLRLRHASAAIATFGLAVIALAFPAAAATIQATYDASILNVVTLGKVTLTGQTSPTAYSASASVETAGLAALFDETKLSARANGSLAGPLVSFSSYSLSHTYAKPGGKAKSRTVLMQKAMSGVTVTAQPTWSDLGVPPTSAAQKAVSNDPLTVLFGMSVALGVTKTCAGRLLAFDGKEHYAITLSPGGAGVYRGGGYDGKAMICMVKYDPIAGGKALSAADRAKIPMGEAWFAEPGGSGFAPLLRVEVPTPVGAARLDVSSLKVT
ncbi:MAG: DUF3108 domain-containing protein [Alphaproteobacteria bacterium]|nr:DUF3108 domain-containing protein [Alphaproteobacteria bacterium]